MTIRGEIKLINHRKTIEEINQKLNYYKNQQMDSPSVDWPRKQEQELKLLKSGIKDVPSLWNLQKYEGW